MRLLNTLTLQVENFVNETCTEYAILSHTWGVDEVSYRDIQFLAEARLKGGFSKLQAFCEVAAAAGFKYGWMDTCCIDQSSTAEVSEAINSMFKWYQNATLCYVYLADVHVANRRLNSIHQSEPSCPFVNSKWFTRGWTLQELLASRDLIFYDTDWARLGMKEELLESIQLATGIDVDAIKSLKIHDFCVAEKMSWAADRITTRPEDIAYSLLGLFGVTMPLVYGEGDRAFIRLQREILSHTDDRSILAWSGFDGQYTAVLAQSPAFFKPFRYNNAQVSLNRQTVSPLMLVGLGLSIEVRLWPVAYKTYLATINYPNGLNISSQQTCFFLRWISHTEQYVRARHEDNQLIEGSHSSSTDSLTLATRHRHLKRPCVTRTVFIQQNMEHPTVFHNIYYIYRRAPKATPSFRLDTAVSGEESGLKLVEINHTGRWDADQQLLKLNADHIGTAAIFTFDQDGILGSFSTDSPRKILVGYDFHFFPVCVIVTSKGLRQPKLSTKSRRPSRITDDLSRISIDDITCFEETGWSTIAEDNILDEVEGCRGTWALRLNTYDEVRATFSDNNWSISMKLEEWDSWEWCVTIRRHESGHSSKSWRPQYCPNQFRVTTIRKALQKKHTRNVRAEDEDDAQIKM